MLTYCRPENLEDALDLRARFGSDAQVMGGGTILMGAINEGRAGPEVVIGLGQAGLAGVDQADGTTTIGSMTSLQFLAGSDDRVLGNAAKSCGGWAVRNLATVGGNLFAVSPAGDVGVALLALDASIRLASAGGSRTLPLVDFYDDGRTIGDDELVTSIEFRDTSRASRFVKFGRVAGPTPSVVSLAVSATFDGDVASDVRIAVGALGPNPFRARHAEAALEGAPITPEAVDEAAELVSDGVDAMTDAVATGWYRNRMATLHARRVLLSLSAGVQA